MKLRCQVSLRTFVVTIPLLVAFAGMLLDRSNKVRRQVTAVTTLSERKSRYSCIWYDDQLDNSRYDGRQWDRSFLDNLLHDVVAVELKRWDQESLQALSALPSINRLVIGGWYRGPGQPDWSCLGNLDQLRELRIEDELRDSDCHYLASLPNLERLFIGDSDLTEDSLDVISTLHSVVELHLENSDFYAGEFYRLAEMQNLKRLYFESDRIFDVVDVEGQLQKLLPNCTIHKLDFFADADAMLVAGNLVVEFMAVNNGAWPRDWQDLEASHSEHVSLMSCRVTWEEVRNMVEIDFDFDPIKTSQEIGPSDSDPKFQVIRLCNGSSTLG